jgi:hypothetical protein
VLGLLAKTGAAVVFAFMGYSGIAPLGRSPHIWYFVAVFCAAWVVNSATRNWHIQQFGTLVAKLDMVLLYWWVGQHWNFWPIKVAAVAVTLVVALDLLGLHPERWFASAAEGFLGSLAPMPALEAARWRMCLTVADLGEACADYLRGRLPSQPAYAPSTPVDDETTQLIPVLVKLNLAGFYTTGSQPGSTVFLDDLEQNAYVTGFADEATMRSLLAVVSNTRGLRYRIRQTRLRKDHANSDRIRWGIESASDVRSFYGEVCSDEAVAALLVAYQVAIEDRLPGRDSVLWPALEQWADARTEATSR